MNAACPWRVAHHLFSSPTIDTVTVVIVAAAALSHSYTPDICARFGCDGPAPQLVGAGTLAVMVVAAGLLLYRAVKYEDIDHPPLRRGTTLTVVSAACVLTVAHDLCHISVGECNAAPHVWTVVFAILVLCILYVNQKAVWSVGTGGTEGRKVADRSYLDTMMDGRRFVWRYWTGTAAIIALVWWLDIAGWFFEPEILVPLLAGLFGPFIALWFANHERNKRIMENYFYKTQILLHMGILLSNAALQFRRQAAGLDSGGTDMPEDGGAAVNNMLVLDYQHHRGHVERLSTNTHVNTGVRYNIINLAYALDSMLTRHRQPPTPDDHATEAEMLLKLLDMMGKLEYFTTDRDPDVRRMWSLVRQKISDVRTEVVKLT